MLMKLAATAVIIATAIVLITTSAAEAKENDNQNKYPPHGIITVHYLHLTFMFVIYTMLKTQRWLLLRTRKGTIFYGFPKPAK